MSHLPYGKTLERHCTPYFNFTHYNFTEKKSVWVGATAVSEIHADFDVDFAAD